METTKKIFKIQWQLMSIILPVTIIPLLLIVIISSFSVVNHLKQESFTFYSDLLQQVATNIDFVYDQNARTLSNMTEIPELKKILASPQYKSKEEEIRLSRELIGDESVRGGLRNTVEEKIEGVVLIGELDRKSIINETNYKVHYVSSGSQDIRFNKLLEDPFFLKTKENTSLNMTLGKISEKSVSTIPGNNNRAGIIFPIHFDTNKEKPKTFTKFIFIAFFSQFMPKFYEEIKKLNYGTLYIIDQFEEILSINHPGSNDYYEYDTTKNKYILLEDDNPDDPDELMTFEDYKQLNTTQDILKLDRTKKAVENQMFYTEYEYNKHIIETIKHNNKSYMVIAVKAQSSNVKLIFFLPVSNIMKPIYNVAKIIIIITIIIIFVVIIISFFLSRNFTNPIKQLSNAATNLSRGDYNLHITTKSNNEIGVLAEGFNNMVKNIKAYQDQLLTTEREKSEMDIALNIQGSLIPPTIQTSLYYDITAKMIPAKDIGGDYYDIITDIPEKLWLGIGDVSGHGLASGLIMMMIQTAFNTILMNYDDISPVKLISEVNKVAYRNIKERLSTDHFMTQVFLEALPDGTIKHAGAHLDILVYRANTERIERIKTSGIWLGIIPDSTKSSTESTFKLNKDDIVLLYTDGVIEAMDKNNKQYDMERLIDKFKSSASASKKIEQIQEDIIEDIFNFMHEQVDDITLVIFRKKLK